mgnify:CR=1 FL=1|jgi:hypothetical protein
MSDQTVFESSGDEFTGADLDSAFTIHFLSQAEKKTG